MTSQELILAEMLALRCSIAALARELLLRQGSEAFHHAQAQAERFAASAAHSGGSFDASVKDRAVRVVSDIFTQADGA